MRDLKSSTLPIIPFVLCPLLLAGETWVETTQKDFADGCYEHNIYASHRSYKDSLPGAIEFVQRFDYNNDGWMDVITSNVVQLGPRMVRDSFYIYWNQKTSPFFDEAKRTAYPTGGSGEICGTDLNIDGYPDLVVGNYRMYPADTTDTLRGGVTIFWGTPDGPDPSYYDSLPGAGMMEAVYIADLNRDGYLDIISGGSPGSTYVDMFGNWTGMDTVGIWWGQPGGPKGIRYSEDSVTTLVGHIPRHNFEIADFDKDGYYDIAVVNYHRYKDTVGLKLTDTIPHLIFWGSDSGYHSEDTTQLRFFQPQAHGLTVADFNKDGWLDLVFTGLELDTFAFVYYGDGPRKFKGPDTLYPGRCFGGSIAADMNGDGWLDIIFLVGNSEAVELHPLWIYYGGPDGFSEEAKSRVGPKEWGTSGGLLADFNKDGEIDLWVDDWITLGGYSGILWGPDFGRIRQVPNHTDHHSVSWELGNTYNREPYEEYISSIYDAGSVVNWDGVFAIDSCPENTYITMAVRTGNTPTPDNSWSGWYELPQRPSEKNDWFCGDVPDSLNSRYIQYRATFHYPDYDMGRLPVLYETRIGYKSTGVQKSKSLGVEGRLMVKPSIIEDRGIIEYSLLQRSEVVLGLYDVMGRLVYILDKGWRGSGRHKVFLNSYGLSPGVYFIQLKDQATTLNKRVVIVK